ncbi:hypothetical protein SEVIR_5G294350v4 [Setaria viridis]
MNNKQRISLITPVSTGGFGPNTHSPKKVMHDKHHGKENIGKVNGHRQPEHPTRESRQTTAPHLPPAPPPPAQLVLMGASSSSAAWPNHHTDAPNPNEDTERGCGDRFLGGLKWAEKQWRSAGARDNFRR